MPESLILLPGLLNDERLWAHQMAQLADLAEIRVADLVGPDTIGAMAERVLVTRPGPLALAGLSMGGYVAFEVMRRDWRCWIPRHGLIRPSRAPGGAA